MMNTYAILLHLMDNFHDESFHQQFHNLTNAAKSWSLPN